MKILKFIFHLDHIFVVFLTLVLLWLLSLCIVNISFLKPIDRALDEFSITDMFWEIENTKVPDTCQLITLVDMTELHSRADIGQLLSQIDAHNPLCTGVDLLFEGEKDDVLGNIILESTILNLDNTFVFAKKLTEYNDSTNDFRSSVQSYFVEQIPIKEAYTNFTDNLQHATIRTYTTHQQNVGTDILSFPAAIAHQIDSSFVSLGTEELLINYKHTIFPTLKYNEIDQYPQLIEGRIVLVGTLQEEQDMHLTPLGKTPGMKIHAYSLLTLLENKNIQRLPWLINLIICIMLCWMLQITLTAVHTYLARHNRYGLVYFLLQSNIASTIIFISWIILVSYALFILLIKYQTIIDSTMALASITLLMEARGLYSAIINTIAKKRDWRLIRNSLFIEK